MKTLFEDVQNLSSFALLRLPPYIPFDDDVARLMRPVTRDNEPKESPGMAWDIFHRFKGVER